MTPTAASLKQGDVVFAAGKWRLLCCSPDRRNGFVVIHGPDGTPIAWQDNEVVELAPAVQRSTTPTNPA